jgi:hypothetical protein
MVNLTRYVHAKITIKRCDADAVADECRKLPSVAGRGSGGAWRRERQLLGEAAAARGGGG